MTFGDMKETVETQMKKLKLSEHLIKRCGKHSAYFRPGKQFNLFYSK
jgi:hypothetical protein